MLAGIRASLMGVAALFALVGAAWAEASPILRPITPESMEQSVLDRVRDRALAIGMTDPESFAAASYLIVRNGTVLGALVSGRAGDARLDGHEKTCFQAIVLPGATPPDLLPTIGRWPWAREDCHGIVAIGLLRARPPQIRIGIVYDAAAAASQPREPVVLIWRPGQALAIDTLATRRCVTDGAETLDRMRKSLAED